MKQLGYYDGETTGGACLCERCEKPVTCHDCRDTKWITYTEDGGGISRLRKCDCIGETRSVKGMPVEFNGATMDNFVPNSDRAASISSGYRFLSGEVNDLYIRGAVGVGKSRLMASVLNEVVKQRSATFVRVPELLDRMRMSGFSDSSSSSEEAEYLAMHRDVDVLGLDDVGADKGSDYARRTIQTLYEHRMDHGKRTIWTSNLTLAELEEFFGDERLSSRIAGNADVVNMGGVDMRLVAP
jgi:DNA replication protein DnaC